VYLVAALDRPGSTPPSHSGTKKSNDAIPDISLERVRSVGDFPRVISYLCKCVQEMMALVKSRPPLLNRTTVKALLWDVGILHPHRRLLCSALSSHPPRSLGAGA